MRQFPPTAVYKGEVDADSYLDGVTAGIPHRQIALEELLLLWLENANPACRKLEMQTISRALPRAWAKTGKRRPASKEIIAITTRSSIRVKPRFATFFMANEFLC